MKHTKTWGAFLTALLAVVVFSGTSFADFKGDTQQIVNDFNNLNSNQSRKGVYFQYPDNIPGLSYYPRIVTLRLPSNYEKPNLDAYSAAGTQGVNNQGLSYFTSVCVEPDNTNGLRNGNGVGNVLVGTLNYKDNMSKTSKGYALSVGAALLYKMYATGEYAVNLNNESQKLTFQQTIRGLMKIVDPDTKKVYSIDAGIRSILSNLIQGDIMATYDPGKYYDYIGDYSVFVMNVTSTNGKVDSQDFLYIVKHEGSDVPEPATLLLWTLGGLGVAGTSWARKRRLVKAA